MNFVGKRNRECDVEDPDLTDFKVYCKACGATKTPQWREGPLGPKTLCNACGVKWLRQKKSREAGPPARVHGSRRVHGTVGSSEDASHPGSRGGLLLPPGSSEGWSDPWTLCADDEDVATAADLLLLAGIASGASHNVAAVPTRSAGSNEHDSATTIHLPIVKAETRPPTTGGQLLHRRAVARRPAVLQPPPAVMQRILAPMPIPVVLYEPQLAAVSDQAEESGLVVAGCDNNKCNSADSHADYAPAPVAAPATSVPPHELAELAMLQAAVISAFAELQAADAARIATLECLAQTQMAADLARAQAVELVQRLHQELRSVSAPSTRLPAASGEVQPAAALHIGQRPPQTQAQLLGH